MLQRLQDKRKKPLQRKLRRQPIFNLESEISNIKIVVPFGEIIRVTEYRKKIVRMLNAEVGSSDILNLHEDHPTLFVGSRVENEKNEELPPFYVSLNIHDMIVHNSMLDSGASHNLMPKVIMERLGLDITRPYKDLFSFYSKRVKCIGLIKDVVVSLSQIPTKTILMDIILVDIPPKFSMFL